MMEISLLPYPGMSLVDSFTRQAIFNNGYDIHEQASGFKSVENILSDMENSTKYAKGMILRMQESNNQWSRSLEETIQSMQSKLRQAHNMYEHLNNQFRYVVAANWFLHARITSQEEKIQKDQGIYEELLKEYENLKSKISEGYCRQTQIEPDRQSADHSYDEIDDMSRNVGEEMIIRQQMDQMTREHNEHLQKLKTENALHEKNQLQVVVHGCYMKELKQTEVEIENLLRELKVSRTRDLLAIAKSPEDMMKIYVKNEQTLVKEMDLLSQDVAQKENEIKELNLSLKSVEYQSNEDRIKLLRQLQRKIGQIFILKKQKHLMQTRLNTVQETVKLLKQEAFVTTGVISEPSQQLKQLIEKDVQLEKDYKKTQQDLQNHDRLCSDYGVATPIELFEENNRNVEVAGVSRENKIPPDISTMYDRLQPDAKSSLQDVAGSHDSLDPLKIAHLYKNLYEIHWRDAIKAANIIDFDMRCEKNLSIFENACALCTEIFETQKMVKIIHLKQKSTDGCNPDETRVLELMKNETTEFSLNLMYQIFINQRGLVRSKTSLTDKFPFVKESIRIGWLMNLSDPPVLVHKKTKRGDRFDPNFYQSYTCKGKKVDFVVLPALVNMDGLVIAKGIVECEP